MLGNPEGYGGVSDIRGANQNVPEGDPKPIEGKDTESEGIMGGKGNGALLNDYWNILQNIRSVKLSGCTLKKQAETCPKKP